MYEPSGPMRVPRLVYISRRSSRAGCCHRPDQGLFVTFAETQPGPQSELLTDLLWGFEDMLHEEAAFGKCMQVSDGSGPWPYLGAVRSSLYQRSTPGHSPAKMLSTKNGDI